jgi:LysR family transcriptional regulator, benzoate and cis,cis-muconate-responsive activator of ben and cat genes
MELRHLRYFVAVAEELNMTRAAARLHVSQPPLSRQIRDLEDDLGVELIHHGSKPIRLTEAGQIFFSEAQAVLQRAAEATRSVKAICADANGQLNIGYAPSLTVKLLPEILRQFHEKNPAAQIHLHDLSTEEILCGLKDRRLDMALLIRPATKMLHGLLFENLQRYAVRVAIPLIHPLAKTRKISLEQLSNERLIAYTKSGYPEYHEMLAKLFAPGKRTPRIAEEHDGASSMIAAVEAGHGVAVVHQGFASLTGSRLKLLPIQPSPAPFTIGILCRQENQSAIQRQFLAIARLSAQV